MTSTCGTYIENFDLASAVRKSLLIFNIPDTMATSFNSASLSSYPIKPGIDPGGVDGMASQPPFQMKKK